MTNSPLSEFSIQNSEFPNSPYSPHPPPPTASQKSPSRSPHPSPPAASPGSPPRASSAAPDSPPPRSASPPVAPAHSAAATPRRSAASPSPDRSEAPAICPRSGAPCTQSPSPPEAPALQNRRTESPYLLYLSHPCHYVLFAAIRPSPYLSPLPRKAPYSMHSYASRQAPASPSTPLFSGWPEGPLLDSPKPPRAICSENPPATSTMWHRHCV